MASIWRQHYHDQIYLYCTAAQNQKTVTAYISSRQVLSKYKKATLI